MPCQRRRRTWGASKDVKIHGNGKVFITALISDTVCTLEKANSIEKVIGGHVQIPLGEGVAARDGVGKRVVGGAVGSAMESW